MSYRHILSNSGVVHAQPMDSNRLVCGRLNDEWPDTDAPITCKVCARSIELSRNHRIARELTKLVRMLHADMINGPVAYMHADRRTIDRMKEIVEGE